MVDALDVEQGRRNTTCIQQHMRTNLRTESGRYGCRCRVICCRISIPPCIRPKKQRTFGSQVPTAASGKNRNSLNIRRADRPYPCGFCGGSLCKREPRLHAPPSTPKIPESIRESAPKPPPKCLFFVRKLGTFPISLRLVFVGRSPLI